MKRCPECRRDYYDDTLLYCLDDGANLLEGPASMDEPATAILSGEDFVNEAPTKKIKGMRDSHPVQSASATASDPRSVSKRKYGWIIAGLSIIVGAGIYAIYHNAAGSSAPPHFQSIKLTRVTSEGAVESATISPDGKYIAYTLEESGKRSLWTKNLTSDSRVQIAAPIESTSMFAGTFSPDGSYVYYTRVDDQNPKGALYFVPVLGGNSKKIVDDVSQPVSISPDGKQIVYGRFHLNAPEANLYSANADGTGESLLISVKEPDFLTGANAVWSPDGRSLAFGYGSQIKDSDPTEKQFDMRVAVLSLADKSLRTVSKTGWPHLGNFAWLSDGSGVVFVAGEEQSRAWQLWECRIESGEARRLTSDLNEYDLFSLTITNDSKYLIAVQHDPVSQIWVAPANDVSRARAVVSRKNVQDGRGGLAWTPDGRIVFDSTVNPKTSIWSMNADGTDAKPLTDNSLNAFSPEVSPDGRAIFFGSVKSGMQIWRMDSDGGSKRQLTNFEGAPTYSVTPDGKWLIYNPYTGGIYKMPVNGGEAVKIVSGAGFVYPQVSPDGRLLAYFFTGGETKRPRIVVTNFGDGSPVRTFDIPVSGAPPHFESLSYRGFHWSPDSSGLVYINTLGGVSNLWRQPLDVGPAKQITDFKSDRIYRFAYSNDGKTLAFARGSSSSDVVLITGQK